jgi:hypothetical protein
MKPTLCQSTKHRARVQNRYEVESYSNFVCRPVQLNVETWDICTKKYQEQENEQHDECDDTDGPSEADSRLKMMENNGEYDSACFISNISISKMTKGK